MQDLILFITCALSFKLVGPSLSSPCSGLMGQHWNALIWLNFQSHNICTDHVLLCSIFTSSRCISKSTTQFIPCFQQLPILTIPTTIPWLRRPSQILAPPLWAQGPPRPSLCTKDSPSPWDCNGPSSWAPRVTWRDVGHVGLGRMAPKHGGKW